MVVKKFLHALINTSSRQPFQGSLLGHEHNLIHLRYDEITAVSWMISIASEEGHWVASGWLRVHETPQQQELGVMLPCK